MTLEQDLARPKIGGWPAPPTGHSLPLSGVVVTDFCWWGVGAISTRILADFGATVLKIESPSRIDHIRAIPPFVDETVLPGEVSGVRGYERSGYFHNHNRNKLSVGLDLKNPRGIEIALRLIAHSDVVTDNFRPGVLEGLGITFDDMRDQKPDIIWASMSGHGQRGPNAGYGANGPVCQALSGLTGTAGLPGEPPSGFGFSYMDQCAGYYGSIAVLLALYRRPMVGDAQRIDLSTIEVGVNFVGPELLSASIDHTTYDSACSPPGNRNPWAGDAPHGVYPTDAEDEWIAISVRTDDEWAALVEMMGRPEWATDARFARREERFAAQDELDRRLIQWTRDQERYVLMARLQRAGVAAGVVQSAQDKARRDPQLRLRNVFPVVPHSVLGPWPVQGIPFKMSACIPQLGARGAPLLGEHTRSILIDRLGYSDDRIDELESSGAVHCG